MRKKKKEKRRMQIFRGSPGIVVEACMGKMFEMLAVRATGCRHSLREN
jgi:hypothetical protein